MDIDMDRWAQDADTALPAIGETEDQYRVRIAALRGLSIRNDAAHPWSHPRRRPRPDGSVDLYTASGEFVRHCTGVAQARETIHTLQPGATSMRLSEDRSQVLIRFPGSKKDYTYVLRPPTESRCEWCGETFLDSDLFVTDVGVLCERCKNGMVRSRL